MTDRELDQLLYRAAGQLPAPVPVPWRPTLRRLCWGVLFTSIRLDILGTGQLFLALGTVLLWLGFRPLRRESLPFRLAYALICLYALGQAAVAVLLATPLAPRLQTLSGAANVACYLLGLLLYLALWRGLRSVFRRTGQQPETRAAGALAACYSLLLPLTLLLTGLHRAGLYELYALLNTISFFVLVAVWIAILICLFRLYRALDRLSYALTPAPVRLSAPWAAVLWLALPALAVLVCTLLFARLPLRAEPADPPNVSQEGLRGELIQLGFPAELLADLTDEDIAPLAGARALRVKREPADPERGFPAFTLVSVRTGPQTVYACCFFRWEDTGGQRLRERIDVLRGHTLEPPGLTTYSIPQGRLLWEEFGQTFQAPLLCGDQQIFPDSWHRYRVEFSLPARSIPVRGYLIWSVQGPTTRPELSPQYTLAVEYFHAFGAPPYPCRDLLSLQPYTWYSNCRYIQFHDSFWASELPCEPAG